MQQFCSTIRLKWKRWLVCLATFFSCCASLIYNAHALNSEKELIWYKINQYSSDGVSEVINDDYFVSQEGRFNPQEELNSFTSIMKEYASGNVTNDITETLCNFPARLTLLSKTVSGFSRPVCEEYEEQVSPKSANSISLFFASGYFKNPSSYFGHNLIKINYDDVNSSGVPIKNSLNYGADVQNSEGSILYIINGLIGGYSASYQKNESFIYTHTYTSSQLRDMWEYEIHLSPEMLQFFLEYSWELRRAKYKYYFFNDNCAHRISRVIEDTLGHSLSRTSGAWLTPIQVVYNLKKVAASSGITIYEKYYPSLETQLGKALKEMEPASFTSFKAHYLNDKVPVLGVKNYSNDVIYSLLDAYDIKAEKFKTRSSDSGEIQAIDSKRQQLLIELYQRPVERRNRYIGEGESLVANLRPLSKMQIGFNNHNSTGGALLRYQIAKNDMLDIPQPNQRKSQFIMGAIGLKSNSEKVEVDEVTLFDIKNLNTSMIPNDGLDNYSWGVSLGYGNRSKVCESCKVVKGGFTAGKSINLSHKSLMYAGSGLQVHSRKSDGIGYWAIKSESGLLVTHSNRVTSHLSGQYLLDIPSNKGEFQAHLSVRKQLAKNINLNFDIQSGNRRLVTGVSFGVLFN